MGFANIARKRVSLVVAATVLCVDIAGAFFGCARCRGGSLRDDQSITAGASLTVSADADGGSPSLQSSSRMWKITLDRSGGVAGIHEEVTLESDGHLERPGCSGPSCLQTQAPGPRVEEVAILLSKLQATHELSADPSWPNPCAHPDCIYTSITFTNDAGTYSVDPRSTFFEPLCGLLSSLPNSPPTEDRNRLDSGHAKGALACTRLLEQTRARIRELEEERQRAIEDVRGRLDIAEHNLTPTHPLVVSLRAQLDAMAEPSAALDALRREERQLVADVASGTCSLDFPEEQ
jgi:hypothetical protein